MEIGMSGIGSLATVVIFQPNNIVFTKVLAALHLNDMDWFIERVGNAVYVTDCNVGRLVNAEVELFVIFRDPGYATHNYPMLGPLGVLLQ